MAVAGTRRPGGWWPEVLLLAGFAALTAALAAGAVGPDSAVSRWCFQHDSGALHWLARALNLLGNGSPLAVICAGIAAWIGYLRRTVRPLLPVITAFLLTLVAILPLKLWTDRAAPRSTLDTRVDLFNPHLPPGEYSVSYPSGHLVNTIVWYWLLVLLLSPWLNPAARRWIRIAPPAIVGVTTVFLNFHWLTDSLAGLLLGLVLARLLARVPWDRVPLPAFFGEWRGPARLGTR